MDPKTLASLDPKLRETYERVMGTGTGTSGAGTNGTAPQPEANTGTTPAPAPEAPPAAAVITPPVPPPAPNGEVKDTQIVIPSVDAPAAKDSTTNSSNLREAVMPGIPSVQEMRVSPVIMPSLSPIPEPPKPVEPIIPPPAQTAQPTRLPSPAAVNMKPIKKKSSMSPILFLFLGIIFFAIYTVFWIKFFKLPFFF